VASIVLEDVTLDYPIYGSSKSFRTELLGRATGGLIRREGRNNERVTVRALEDVSLKLEHGDRLGMIGHNGAGKSTLLRVLAGVFVPTLGRVAIEGRISALFNTVPGLDMDDTGFENIRTCGLFLGLSLAEIAEKTPEIAEFTELGDYLNLPVRTYSAGMITRLGFAIATTINPEILLLDEGLSAGDARFAEHAQQRVDRLVERSSILVIASHSEAMVRSMCNRAILLESGRVITAGNVDEVIETYERVRSR
jgi:ABC-type polysaccharide/polyol phosphate transport system ATPase subunit